MKQRYELRRLKTRDLTMRDNQKCRGWHRETWQRGTRLQGWTSRYLFGCSSKCSQEVIATIDVLGSFSVSFYLFITPPPVGTGSGVLFSLDFFLSLFVSLYLCIFVSLSARLRENGWTDLHEIFREGVEWPWDDLITFWVNSGNGSPQRPPKPPKWGSR